jgi:choline dehydrogenase-like flavoprotein
MLSSVEAFAAACPRATTVCIVGAGAAGITLACELDGSGIDVTLLDSGQRWGQEPCEGTTEAPHPPLTQYRRLGFGGTTSLWGGRCVPYDPIDFERRDHVPDSGWPIPYADVATHYPRAMAYCDAGRDDFTASGSIAPCAPMLAGVVHPDLDLDRIERYSLPTDFGKRYAARLARSTNVRVVSDARVVRLVTAEVSPRIDGVEFASTPDKRHLLRADIVVLAMGGLESTRLLLVSDAGGVGLGNRSSHLGRYYMCHVAGVLGVLRPRAPGAKFHFEKTTDGVYAKRKIQFTADAQRSHKLLNMAFRLHYPDISDPRHRSSVLSAMYLVKQGLAKEYQRILQHGSAQGMQAPVSQHVRNVAGGLPSFAAFGIDWTRRRLLAKRKLPYVLVANADGSYPLDFNAEQMPLRDSRVELSGERDSLGLQRLVVHWRKSQADVDSMVRAFAVLRAGIEANGTCSLEFDPQALRHALAVAAGPVGGHHIGTARMADHGGGGVVDPNCALFDFQNLYVASSAVFPTASHANPTLTIVAMAVRIADRMKTVLRQRTGAGVSTAPVPTP